MAINPLYQIDGLNRLYFDFRWSEFEGDVEFMYRVMSGSLQPVYDSYSVGDMNKTLKYLMDAVSRLSGLIAQILVGRPRFNVFDVTPITGQYGFYGYGLSGVIYSFEHIDGDYLLKMMDDVRDIKTPLYAKYHDKNMVSAWDKPKI